MLTHLSEGLIFSLFRSVEYEEISMTRVKAVGMYISSKIDITK